MKGRINYFFLALSLILLGLGILFLSTLSAIASLQAFENTHYYLLHQLFAVLVGLTLGVAAYKIPLPLIRKWAFPLLILALILMLVVFVPAIGSKFWGAKRWITIGGTSFQPSEFLKLASIVYLAALLSSRFSPDSAAKKTWGPKIKRGYEVVRHVLLPFLLLLGIISLVLLFQRDIGTLGIVALALFAVYFAAGTPIWHMLVSVGAGIAGGILFIGIEPYRVQRLLVFFNPETDPLGIGYQLRQSLIAIGSGGWIGKGLGMSTQKFGFLPQAMSDSVFAILGEETGIIGCLIILALFVLFFWQGLRIAKNAQDSFARLTAVGIVIWLMIQTFMNIASTVGFFPLTGIPLPFFSYGGTHIVAELIAVGLLLNISKNG